ncbi:hypothetical protein M5K25_002573 [Dendrobium thyrsiflorum]|uniref:Uncharacterized protein n=1 Tax=Dendrobium thyrsiflorum TaxID=117978 RepID=A0ABD0VUA5_DENTH
MKREGALNPQNRANSRDGRNGNVQLLLGFMNKRPRVRELANWPSPKEEGAYGFYSESGLNEGLYDFLRHEDKRGDSLYPMLLQPPISRF